MIVGTPRPSSPIIRAHVSFSSISLDAFERLPSLSFSRLMRKRLRSPSGVKRGSRKHDSPPSAWASTRNTSLVGAALALGHRHAAQRARLLVTRDQPRVVLERGELRHPLLSDLGLLAQRR